MDPQVRQFRDFLQLYNTITEKCFNVCVENLLSRRVENSEDTCVAHCVDKFAKVIRYLNISAQFDTCYRLLPG